MDKEAVGMERAREAFEAWVRRVGYDFDLASRDAVGNYLDLDAYLAFDAWEAALAQQPAAQAAGLMDGDCGTLHIAIDLAESMGNAALADGLRSLLSRAAPSGEPVAEVEVVSNGAVFVHVSECARTALGVGKHPVYAAPQPSAQQAEHPAAQKHIAWLHQCLREAGHCIDGGKCHHGCKPNGECFREQTCGPLSGSALGDDWKLPQAEQPAEEARGVDLPSDEQIAEASQQICRLLVGDARKVDTDIIESHIRALFTASAEEARGMDEALKRLIEAVEDAHSDLCGQCASNPIRNAWGEEVSVAKLNEAAALALSLRAILAAPATNKEPK